jgi:hypothetical protein
LSVDRSNTYPLAINDRTGGLVAFGYSGIGASTDPTGNASGFSFAGDTGWVVAGLPTSNTGYYNSRYEIRVGANISSPTLKTFSFNSAGNITLPVGGNLVGNVVATRANLGSVSNLTVTGGTSGQVLTTFGNGTLYWSTVSGGSGNGTPGGPSFSLQFNNSAGGFGGVPTLTYDGNVLFVSRSTTTANVIDANSTQTAIRMVSASNTNGNSTIINVLGSRGNATTQANSVYNDRIGTMNYYAWSSGYKVLGENSRRFTGNVLEQTANTLGVESAIEDTIFASPKSPTGQFIENRFEVRSLRTDANSPYSTKFTTPGEHSLLNFVRSPTANAPLSTSYDVSVYKARGYPWNRLLPNGASNIDTTNTTTLRINDRIGGTIAYGYTGNGSINDPSGTVSGFNTVGDSTWIITGAPTTATGFFDSTYRITVSSNTNTQKYVELNSAGNMVLSNGYFVGNIQSVRANLGNVSNINIGGGIANQYLKTDGTGNLSWETVVDTDDANYDFGIIRGNASSPTSLLLQINQVYFGTYSQPAEIKLDFGTI